MILTFKIKERFGAAIIGFNADVIINARLRLSSGLHAFGSAARPLRPQIKDGVVLEYIHFQDFQPFQHLSVPHRKLQSQENALLKVIPESTRKEVTQMKRTWVFVMESRNSHTVNADQLH